MLDTKDFIKRVIDWLRHSNRRERLVAFLAYRYTVYRSRRRLRNDIQKEQHNIQNYRDRIPPKPVPLTWDYLESCGLASEQKNTVSDNMAAQESQFDEEIRCIMANIMPKSTIIDVGSNIGIFGGILLKRGYDVISIEPLQRNISKQAQLYQKYIKDKRLFLYNVACSDKAGYSNLFISSDPDGSLSSLEERWILDVFLGCWSGRTLLVETHPLSTIINQYSEDTVISCIKIDTEGHEDKVIQGTFDNLPQSRFPEIIMFEFNTNRENTVCFNRCISLLKRNGYSDIKYFIRHGCTLLYESDWTKNDFDITKFDKQQGDIPPGFRYGNAIAKRYS